MEVVTDIRAPYRFFVAGRCKPGGSKRFVGHAANGSGVIIDDNPDAAAWKQTVGLTVANEMRRRRLPLLGGPLDVSLTFYLRRPQGHGRLKDGAPVWPTCRPDTLKLARPTEDALSGIVYEDDAQIVKETLVKRYADGNGNLEGVEIVVRPAEEVGDA
jgi:Holliday junction resolvase RusA-like endonuclease